MDPEVTAEGSLDRAERAIFGGEFDQFVFLADETFAIEKNCPPMKH